MISKPTDIFGNDLKVGDNVAWGEATSSYNCCIYCGEIIEISQKLQETHIKVKITHSGDNYFYRIGKIRLFKYPRNYFNLVKIQ